MKKLLGILVLTLILGHHASAATSVDRVKVICGKTGFSDLTQIEIQETDYKGQYQILETLAATSAKKATTVYSPVFSIIEIEKSDFPKLTPWNGYTRTLNRNGPGYYSITLQDECSSSTISLTCTEQF